MIDLTRHLVEDWRQAWRWISMRAMAASLIILGGWSAMPDSLRSHLPEWLATGTAAIALVVGIAGRLYKQKPPAP